MSIPTKPSQLPTIDAPDVFLTARTGDNRYGTMPYGQLPGIDEAVAATAADREAAEQAKVDAEAAAAQAALYGPLTFPSAAAFFASSTPDASMIGKRAGTQDGLAWDIVEPGDGDFDHPETGVGVRVVANGGVRYAAEAFGMSTDATATENAAALALALTALSDGQTLTGRDEYVVDGVSVTLSVERVTISLRLKYSGSNGSNAVLRINGARRSTIDVSVDADDNDIHPLRLDDCDGSIVPRSAVLKNVVGVNQVVAGVFTRNSPDMLLTPTINNIHGSGNHAVRGVMISDTLVSINRSFVSPMISGVTIETGGASDDADGLYAENSVPGHYGGLIVADGIYNNCQKRAVKVYSANPTIARNIGVVDLPVPMSSFIASYTAHAGTIENNVFEKVGTGGVERPIDLGDPSSSNPIRAISRGNILKSEEVDSSSKGYQVNGPIGNILIDGDEIVGARAFMQSYASTSATGQILTIKDVVFDDLSYGGRSFATLPGDFTVLRLVGVVARNTVSGHYLVYAANCSDGVIEIERAYHNYTGGFTFASVRPLNAWDQNSGKSGYERYENGKRILCRNGEPTTGVYAVGDEIHRFTTTAGSWTRKVCTTAGTAGSGVVWKDYATASS